MRPIVFNLHNFPVTDMEHAATLCERIHRIDAKESFANHALVVLGNAVKHTHFSFTHFNTTPLELVESYSETIPPDAFSAFKAQIDQHPLLRLLIRSPKSQIRTLQSAMPGTVFRRTELYNEIFAPLAIEDQLFINLRQKNDLFLITYDRDRAFDENEQALMQLLQPHVQLAWENWHRTRDLQQQVQMLKEKSIVSEAAAKQANAARQLMDSLTPQQRNIAELVAQGLENRAIAEALHIAPKTVGKHLENIFQTLEIHHRAALAARWQQAKVP